jgi:hypothetical protein
VPRNSEPPSFEDFVDWLGERDRDADTEHAELSPDVLTVARVAYQEFGDLRRSQRDELIARARKGIYYEEIELMAAADSDHERWMPRLRTPNGFAISTLYASGSAHGSAPVGLLVECPDDLIGLFKGLKVSILVAGSWIDLGEIDMDGKTSGDLPPGMEFKPPFGFRVGQIEQQPEALRKPDEPS